VPCHAAHPPQSIGARAPSASDLSSAETDKVAATPNKAPPSVAASTPLSGTWKSK